MSKEEILKEFEVLAREDLGIGGKTYWEAIVFSQSYLSQSLDRIEAETRKKIGIEFFRWFHTDDAESVEEAIERITGVKYMTEKQFKKKYGK